MPIPIPNLDDRNYDQLLNETMNVITRYFPGYAGIGPSDPAMTVNDLFAYLFDIAFYQINRITPETRQNFAALLGIEKDPGRPPEEAIRLAIASLSQINRAVTAGDIADLIKNTTADPKVYSEPVVRVCVLPGNPASVFAVQKGAVTGEITDRHKEDLRNLYFCLRACCPIGSRFLIQHAPVLNFNLTAEIVKRRDSTLLGSDLIEKVNNALAAFFDPITGGDSGTGWEFGRAVSRSEIYALMEGIPEVDHVNILWIYYPGNILYYDELPPAGVGGLVQFSQTFLVKLNQTFLTVK